MLGDACLFKHVYARVCTCVCEFGLLTVWTTESFPELKKNSVGAFRCDTALNISCFAAMTVAFSFFSQVVVLNVKGAKKQVGLQDVVTCEMKTTDRWVFKM